MASDLFAAMLESDGRGLPGLSGPQLEMLRRLDRLAREVQSAWLKRCLPDKEFDPEVGKGPPTQEMLDRLSERGNRLRAEVVSRFEAIALEVVLTPQQAEAAKRLLWHKVGVWALTDPELVRRLGLSKAQRDRISTQLHERASVKFDADEETRRVWNSVSEEHRTGKIDDFEWTSRHDEAGRACLAVMARYDERAWSILHAEQRRKLDEMMKDARQRAEAARQPAMIDD
jgi:hypothetical protein